jgi:hypothetical protein
MTRIAALAKALASGAPEVDLDKKDLSSDALWRRLSSLTCLY